MKSANIGLRNYLNSLNRAERAVKKAEILKECEMSTYAFEKKLGNTKLRFSKLEREKIEEITGIDQSELFNE